MNRESLSQLADVDLPLPPNWTPWVIAATVAALAVALLMGTWWQHNHKRHTKISGTVEHLSPEQELERLAAQWQVNALSPRELAYRLATLLRLGLQLPQLEAAPPATIRSETHRWPGLIEDLAALRYRPEATLALNPELVPVIRTWLREARGGT